MVKHNDDFIQNALRTQLAPSNERAFDYDELLDLLAEHDGESFDVFVRLSYHLSVMNLSVAELQRASKMIANLAVDVLAFNVSQEDTSDEQYDAAIAGQQRVAA